MLKCCKIYEFHLLESVEIVLRYQSGTNCITRTISSREVPAYLQHSLAWVTLKVNEIVLSERTKSQQLINWRNKEDRQGE